MMCIKICWMPLMPKIIQTFYERIDHLPPMLDPAFQKSDSLLKQTQTSDYQCVK